MYEIILASASPSRKRLLESIGIHPTIIVSGVNEELPEITSLPPAEMVIALAIMKAQTVAQSLKEQGKDAIVIGCDSTFEFDGQNLGKPETVANAVARAKTMQGKSGLLHTGHCIISTAKNLEFSDLSTSLVHFAHLSDAEIEAYVATGEPLQVAGGFTLDGFSAPFIDRIDGDPSGIIGLSLSTLRKGVIALGYKWEDIGLVNK
jgi:septum formation protein